MSLKHTILVLLENQSASGYDIVKQFRGSFGHFWNASHQQVYQELGKLSKAGLVSWTSVSQEGKPDKKTYAITPEGITELRRWLCEPIPPQKVKDHLMVRMAAAHLVDPMILHDQLTERMEKCRKKLAMLRSYQADARTLPAQNPLQSELTFLALKRGIQLQETWLEWAQEIQSVLIRYSQNSPDSFR